MLIREGGRRPEWDGLTKYAIRRYPDLPVQQALDRFVVDRVRAGLGALARVRPDGPRRDVRRTKFYSFDELSMVVYRLRTTVPTRVCRVSDGPVRTIAPGVAEQNTTVVTRQARTFCIDRHFDQGMAIEQRKRDWLAAELKVMRRELHHAVDQYEWSGVASC